MRFLSWADTQRRFFLEAKKQNRLGHAYLLSGIKGLGKLSFAEEISQWLMCLNLQKERACQECQACQLYNANTHPDFYRLKLEEDSAQIKIDQVREVIGFCVQTNQISAYKIVVIEQAEKLNTAAANALLKTLEEPGSQTVLFLVTHQWTKLPATIRSRCQQVQFYPPSEEISMDWLLKQGIAEDDAKVLLNLAGKAPLAAYELYETDFLAKRRQWFSEWVNWQIGKISISQVLKTWSSISLLDLLMQMQTWYADICKLQQGIGTEQIYNQDFLETLSKLNDKAVIKSAWQAYQEVLKSYLAFQASPNLNAELILADLLFKLKY